MPSPIAGLSPRALYNRFIKREDGSVTIEAVLWLPLFALFFVMIADIALIFNGQARLQRIVQDGNRYLSVGRLADEDAVEEFVKAAAKGLTENLDVETTYDNSLGLIITNVTVKAGELDAVGVITALANVDLVVWSTHMKEF